MLAKTVERNGKNWDTQIPFVLFAYRSSPQESTCESPFFLLYGRDQGRTQGGALGAKPGLSNIATSMSLFNYFQKVSDQEELSR